MNEIVTSLTNRATGFAWGRFPEDPGFVPAKLPDYAEEVRRFLLLDQPRDYPVLALLSALAGSPWLLEEVGSLDELRQLTYFSPPPDTLAGGDLVGNVRGPARMALRPDYWPVESLFEIAWAGSHETVIRDATQRWRVQSGVTPDNHLTLEWPEVFQANGKIKLDGAWTEGSILTLHTWPSAYPYTAMVGLAETKRPVNNLLMHSGLATYWHGARSDLEKAATLAGALIKTYRNSL